MSLAVLLFRNIQGTLIIALKTELYYFIATNLLQYSMPQKYTELKKILIYNLKYFSYIQIVQIECLRDIGEISPPSKMLSPQMSIQTGLLLVTPSRGNYPLIYHGHFYADVLFTSCSGWFGKGWLKIYFAHTCVWDIHIMICSLIHNIYTV